MNFAGSFGSLRRHPGRVAVVILVIYWMMAVTASVNFCAAGDETFHIAGGLAYWRFGENELQPENGNLPKRWMTLPLLAATVHWPAGDGSLPQSVAAAGVGYRLFYSSGNHPAILLLAARAMIALLGVGLGALIWWWSRRLWGDGAALLAVALYALSPTLLAQGALATSDLAVSLFFLAAVTTYWRLLERVSPGRVLACGLAVGALFLTKMSCVLVLPMMVVLAVIRVSTGGPLPWSLRRPRDTRTRTGRAAAIGAATLAAGLVAWTAVWAAFGFRFPMFGARTEPAIVLDTPWSALTASNPLPFQVIAFFRDHHLLPEAWLYGFASTLDSLASRPAFLNGAYSIHGWPWYFPYAFLVKTPLPLLGLMLLGAWAALRRRRDDCPPAPAPTTGAAPASAPSRWYAASPLMVLSVVYGLYAVTSHINIGERHILPAITPLFVLAGGAVVWIRGRRPRFRALTVAALVIWLAAESWHVRPYYLEYFNELAGGPRGGYRHLVDSNLDWGQDLPALAQWLDDHAAARTPVYLAYFGPGDPEACGILCHRLLSVTFSPYPVPASFRLTGGWYCISATLFQGVYTRTPGAWTPTYEYLYRELARRRATGRLTARQAVHFLHLRFGRLRRYLEHRRPDAMAGYSILIFRLTDAEVAGALRLPPAPAPAVNGR